MKLFQLIESDDGVMTAKVATYDGGKLQSSGVVDMAQMPDDIGKLFDAPVGESAISSPAAELLAEAEPAQPPTDGEAVQAAIREARKAIASEQANR